MKDVSFVNMFRPNDMSSCERDGRCRNDFMRMTALSMGPMRTIAWIRMLAVE